MTLRIDTFDNVRGGNALYKALAHPLAAAPARALIRRLERCGKIAIVDPQGAAAGFAELFELSAVDIAGVYVQDVARIGGPVLGCVAEGVPALAQSGARAVLVAAFDADRLIGQIAPFLPPSSDLVSLDAMRLPAERLTNPRNYLDPLNFATNFALFRDTGAVHTRLVTLNYWPGYGSKGVTCWLTLFDGAGEIVAEWSEAPTAEAGAIVIDSREVRRRFGLGDFAGQLFIHVAGAAGHDIVKYALDTYGSDDAALSCTHDANAWPSDRYAGLPAPARSASTRWATSMSCRSTRRSVRSRRAPSMSPSCCRGLPGRRRSSCAPASTWCGRATRSSRPAGAGSPMSISSAPTSSPTPSCRGSASGSARAICCRRRSCRAANGAASCCRRRWRWRRKSCRSPRSPTVPTATRSPATALAGCRARTASRSTSTIWAQRSATATAMSSWSTISPRAAAATAGCTPSSAIATARAAMPPRPASARMSSTPSSPIATSRNPIPAGRRDCRRRCSCGSARASTTRCAT